MRVRWIALTAAVIVFAAIATAQMMPPGMPGHIEGAPSPGPALTPGQIAAITEYLQLTPEQVAAWKQFRAEGFAAALPILESVRAEKKLLDAALATANPDPAKVGKLVISLHAKGSQLRDVKEGGHAKFVALLTPDQKTKLEAMEKAVEILRMQRRGGN